MGDTRLDEIIRDLGGEAEYFDVGTVVPQKVDISIMEGMSANDFIVFTSQNAVNAFMWNLKENGKDARFAGNSKIAAVGIKTAEALNNFGIEADIIPNKHTASDLVDRLTGYITSETKVLWFAARDANQTSFDKLKDKCVLHKMTCYINEDIANSISEDDKTYFDSCDGIIFTSASNVRRTIEKISKELPPYIYSIGPSCSKELLKYGIHKFFESEESSYEGLARIL